MEMISDEIRCFVKRSYADEHMDPRELLALAERIDAEMVELPKDGGGKIWTGCEDFFWVESRGGVWVHHSLLSLDLINGSKWYVRDTRGHGYEAGLVWHERHDSLERIADELEQWSDDNRVNGSGEVFFRAGDLAERIRKLAKED